MIQIINVKTHAEICSGLTYSGNVLFEGETVKEVLEEIKQYTNGKAGGMKFMKIDDFGNDDEHGSNAWAITINHIPYIGGWLGWENKYHGEFDNLKVKSVNVNGGWYCAYDFNIITY